METERIFCVIHVSPMIGVSVVSVVIAKSEVSSRVICLAVLRDLSFKLEVASEGHCFIAPTTRGRILKWILNGALLGILWLLAHRNLFL